MDSFKDREKNFEKKFAHDEELQFKVECTKKQIPWSVGFSNFKL